VEFKINCPEMNDVKQVLTTQMGYIFTKLKMFDGFLSLDLNKKTQMLKKYNVIHRYYGKKIISLENKIDNLEKLIIKIIEGKKTSRATKVMKPEKIGKLSQSCVRSAVKSCIKKRNKK
jgi:hypothetical protein